MQATGLGSEGIEVSGAGTTLNASGITVTTTGGYDFENNAVPHGVYNGPDSNLGYTTGGTANLSNSTVSASGFEAHAVLTRDGTTMIIGGAYSTSGAIADVIVGQGAGTNVSVSGATILATGLGAPGVSLVGAGSSMSLSNDTITTSGQPYETGRDAIGVYNGTNAAGTFVGGGTLQITNSTIMTSGASAFGVDTEDGGSTKISGGSIATSGAQSDAVLGLSGAQVSVQGTTISTSGNAAKGLDIQGAGTTLAASGVSVTTTGTINSATGDPAEGLYNGNGKGSGSGSTGGGSATLTNVTILTKGYDLDGVDTENGGKTVLNEGSVTTTGAAAYAVVADSGGHRVA